MPNTIAQCLRQATEQLQSSSDSARLDAEVLLAHLLQKERIYFLTWPEEELSVSMQQQYQALINRRQKGEPIAYITGFQEFWSLRLKVTPDTLIPRPDTEILVQTALEHIPEAKDYSIADLGTGSGAIALAIAVERPLCHITGVDQSEAAVLIARENATRLGIHNVRFERGNWLDTFADQSLDMILSNPPYVAEKDPHMSEGDVRFEPVTALLAGPEGMAAYDIILPEAKRCLKQGGYLLLEHGYDQQARLLMRLQQQGFVKTCGIKDYASHDRVVIGQAT